MNTKPDFTPANALWCSHLRRALQNAGAVAHEIRATEEAMQDEPGDPYLIAERDDFLQAFGEYRRRFNWLLSEGLLTDAFACPPGKVW